MGGARSRGEAEHAGTLLGEGRALPALYGLPRGFLDLAGGWHLQPGWLMERMMRGCSECFSFGTSTPLYGFERAIGHISVGDKARPTLLQMGTELPGTDKLVAIYIPESTDQTYRPGLQSGRVVGAVRLIPMPPGRTVSDYFYRDLIDGSLRWPIGWPVRPSTLPRLNNACFSVMSSKNYTTTAPLHHMLHAFMLDRLSWSLKSLPN
jgi:hypothetical protein